MYFAISVESTEHIIKKIISYLIISQLSQVCDMKTDTFWRITHLKYVANGKNIFGRGRRKNINWECPPASAFRTQLGIRILSAIRDEDDLFTRCQLLHVPVASCSY